MEMKELKVINEQNISESKSCTSLWSDEWTIESSYEGQFNCSNHGWIFPGC
jgi:hypothetical protein